MKRLLPVLLLAVALVGCTTIKAVQGFAITQGQLDGTQNTYDGTALATLKTYATLPACVNGTAISINNRCHDKVLLKKMRDADKAVANAFSATQDQITAGNNSGAVAAWNTLQTAIGTIKQIISDNNLNLI